MMMTIGFGMLMRIPYGSGPILRLMILYVMFKQVAGRNVKAMIHYYRKRTFTKKRV